MTADASSDGRPGPNGPHFVIFAAQRTGSTMLASLLDDHPDLRCFGELFVRNPQAAERALAALPKAFRTRFADYETRHKRWRAYLAGVGKRQTARWGFKLMNNQRDKARDAIMARADCALITLRRDNMLAVYASGAIAKRTGQGVAMVGDAVVNARVVFDPEAFEAHRARYEAGYARLAAALAAAGRDALEVEYAAIAGPNGDAEINRVLDHIGAERRPLAPRTLKRNASDVVSRFENPEAARAHIETLGRPDWATEAV